MINTAQFELIAQSMPILQSTEYILSDHLGSASITTNADGDKTSEVHYTPWGEVLSSWSASASLPMEYTFTGQMSYMDDPSTSETTEDFGLMFFNARWLDPAIGRFAQADSIVPPGVQGYDRYAYVNNSPLNYIDPSGHCSSYTEAGQIDCELEAKSIQTNFGITFRHIHDRFWTFETLAIINASFGRVQDLIGKNAFAKYASHTNIDTTEDSANTDISGRIISVSSAKRNYDDLYNSTIHELAHVLTKRFDGESKENGGSIGKFLSLTGWSITVEACTLIFFNCEQIPGLINPGTGPTKYSRGEADFILSYPSYYEDMADTFMALSVTGMPDANVTWDRNVTTARTEWFFWFIAELNK